MDVMSEEFDSYIGALVADLIFKQHFLRTQTQKVLDQVANSKGENGSQMTQMMAEDMKRTDHLVYVDTTLTHGQAED